jgi:hypothetical protein
LLLSLHAPTMGALYTGLIQLRDVERMLELLVAIATQEHVKRHRTPARKFLSERHLNALPTSGGAADWCTLVPRQLGNASTHSSDVSGQARRNATRNPWRPGMK